MPIRYVLFDLDNTLYAPSSGLWQAIGDRINLYMIKHLGMEPAEVSRKRDDFLAAFGTTLNALRHYYGIDPDEFLAFVHDLPLRDYIGYEPALDQMLGRMPFSKVIFTNADASHARRVLASLGIARHFERIIDIHALEFVNKPDRRAYIKVLEYLSAQPEECVFVEDSLSNIRPARQLGMHTVLVHPGVETDGADHHIQSVTELEAVLSKLLPKPTSP